jgi:hypothetical protein
MYNDESRSIEYLFVKPLGGNVISLQIQTTLDQLNPEFDLVIEKLIYITHDSLPRNVNATITAKVRTKNEYKDMGIKISKSNKEGMSATINLPNACPKRVIK